MGIFLAILDAIDKYGFLMFFAAFGIYVLIKKFFTKKESAPVYNVTSHVDVLDNIRTYLNELLMISGADRAYIIEFHNGGAGLSGSKFKKMTCTYEEITARTTPMQNEIHDVLIAQFPSLITNIIKDGIFQYNDDKSDAENKIDPSTKYFFKQLHVKTCCIVPLKNNAGQIIGMVGVDSLTNKECIECNRWKEALEERESVLTFLISKA